MALPYKAARWPTVTNLNATNYPERLRYLGDNCSLVCLSVSCGVFFIADHILLKDSQLITCQVITSSAKCLRHLPPRF